MRRWRADVGTVGMSFVVSEDMMESLRLASGWSGVSSNSLTSTSYSSSSSSSSSLSPS